MAGHSKYKNIMYRKGAQDKKRSAMFSKLAREITVAAKMGAPDPDMNARLRAAVNAAKARGYDGKAMRTIIRLRKMETHVRQEAEAILDTYKAALGLA